MTVASRGRVSAVGAHAARDALRQAKDFHIEATLPRVIIAIAACKREREREKDIDIVSTGSEVSYYAACRRRISLCQLAMSLSPFGNAINENKWNANRRGRGREEDGGGAAGDWGGQLGVLSSLMRLRSRHIICLAGHWLQLHNLCDDLFKRL